MKKIYILEADPTRFGGIQQFVRNLAGYLPQDRTFLLAYYRDLSGDKTLPVPLIRLNDGKSPARNGAYLSKSSLRRNFALLCDVFRIRRNLARLLKGGDTLVVNSASAILLFCSRNVLKSNRIVLVQHTAAKMMRQRAFDFGGIFRNLKIAMFRKYVDTFVMLSPQEEKEFRGWLPLDGKNIAIIRHSSCFPDRVPDTFPLSVAMLCRLIPLKRVDRAVACAAILPDIRFNIYGDGPLLRKLKKMAANTENVHFCGYTDDIDMVFETNSLLLITSDYEGYGICGIEACVRGRPVVVLNTYPAANDLVVNGVSGLVVDDLSPTALAQAVNKVFADYESYRTGALSHRVVYDADIARAKWRRLLLPEQE